MDKRKRNYNFFVVVANRGVHIFFHLLLKWNYTEKKKFKLTLMKALYLDGKNVSLYFFERNILRGEKNFFFSINFSSVSIV